MIVLFYQDIKKGQSPIAIHSFGYPEAIINTVVTKKINQFHRPTQFSLKKCPVYLHLPWLGNVLLRYEMQIKTAVKCCCFAVEPCIVCTTRQLLPAAKRMHYSLFIKATLFINFCATVIVGMWIVRLKGYNRGLSSTCRKPFFRSIFLRTEAHWPALASQSEALKPKLPFLP